MTDVWTAASTMLFAPWAAWWGSHAALAVAGALPARRQPGGPLSLDVVIPAHDEEGSLPTLLRSLQDQSLAPGCVVVVADHCSDATAEIARSFGAEVIERNDGPPGKPPAIEAGVAFLRDRPGRGEGVIVLDADCECNHDFVAALAARLGPDDEVVQAAYTVIEPDGGAVRASLRRAFALRNVIRPSGADRLGLPCVLTGSGILLRWSALDKLTYGNSQVGFTGNQPAGADLVMGLELLAAGVYPRFTAGATVEAPAPSDDGALATQHLRWEGGQAVNWRRAAGVAVTLAKRADWRGLLGLVDWMAPPLAPTLVAYLVPAAVVGLAVVAGVIPAGALAAPVLTGALLALYLVVGTARLDGGRGVLELAAAGPRYLRWKAGLYAGFRTATPVVRPRDHA